VTFWLAETPSLQICSAPPLIGVDICPPPHPDGAESCLPGSVVPITEIRRVPSVGRAAAYIPLPDIPAAGGSPKCFFSSRGSCSSFSCCYSTAAPRLLLSHHLCHQSLIPLPFFAYAFQRGLLSLDRFSKLIVHFNMNLFPLATIFFFFFDFDFPRDEQDFLDADVHFSCFFVRPLLLPFPSQLLSLNVHPGRVWQGLLSLPSAVLPGLSVRVPALPISTPALGRSPLFLPAWRIKQEVSPMTPPSPRS